VSRRSINESVSAVAAKGGLIGKAFSVATTGSETPRRRGSKPPASQDYAGFASTERSGLIAAGSISRNEESSRAILPEMSGAA